MKSTTFHGRAARAGAAAVLGLWLWTGSAHADVPVSEVAKRHFNEGVRHLTTHNADRFEKAYAEFKAAYADSPSWKILGNLGIVAEALERDGEAIDAYRSYVTGGAKELGASERAQFNADQARLEIGSAVVTLQTEPDGSWIIDERIPEQGSPVVNRYGPSAGSVDLQLRAGRHRIHAELSGYTSETWEFDARPGLQGAHVFELRRANVPSETPPVQQAPFDDRLVSNEAHPAARVGGYVALGMGGMGVGLGTWFLLRAYERRREGRSAFETCIAIPEAAPTCPRSEQKTAEEHKERLRAGLSFGAAAALLTTGMLLLVYAGPSSAKPAEELGLLPWVTPDQLGVTGRF
ncbi:MAG: hypothetical protein RL685_2718 [Pseudomonadota bacterium]|jgi:hypothetical protein